MFRVQDQDKFWGLKFESGPAMLVAGIMNLVAVERMKNADTFAKRLFPKLDRSSKATLGMVVHEQFMQYMLLSILSLVFMDLSYGIAPIVVGQNAFLLFTYAFMHNILFGSWVKLPKSILNIDESKQPARLVWLLINIVMFASVVFYFPAMDMTQDKLIFAGCAFGVILLQWSYCSSRFSEAMWEYEGMAAEELLEPPTAETNDHTLAAKIAAGP